MALSSLSAHSFLATLTSLLICLCAYGCAPVVYKFRKLKSIILLSLITLSLVGCALDTEIDSTLDTGINNTLPPFSIIQDYKAKIAIIGVDSESQEIAECVEKGIKNKLKKSKIISEESLRKKISPWFDICIGHLSNLSYSQY